jgi:SAM-dependent methyltransferase
MSAKQLALTPAATTQGSRPLVDAVGATGPQGAGTADEAIRRFAQAAESFDRHRPSPPPDLIAFVRSMAPQAPPLRVVDLGCGTGLSTRPWSGLCDEVIGVDPASEMLDAATAATSAGNVFFRSGWSHDTGLPTGCAAVVTCASSFHWMDPVPTLREVRRILRPGGVLAVYGQQMPPVAHGGHAIAVQCEQLLHFVRQLDREHSAINAPRPARWAEMHALLKAAPGTSYCNEFCFHQLVDLTVDQLCDCLQTLSYIDHHVRRGSEEVIGRLRQVREAAARSFGDGSQRYLWCYRLVLSVYA